MIELENEDPLHPHESDIENRKRQQDVQMVRECNGAAQSCNNSFCVCVHFAIILYKVFDMMFIWRCTTADTVARLGRTHLFCCYFIGNKCAYLRWFCSICAAIEKYKLNVAIIRWCSCINFTIHANRSMHRQKNSLMTIVYSGRFFSPKNVPDRKNAKPNPLLLCSTRPFTIKRPRHKVQFLLACPLFCLPTQQWFGPKHMFELVSDLYVRTFNCNHLLNCLAKCIDKICPAKMANVINWFSVYTPLPVDGMHNCTEKRQIIDREQVHLVEHRIRDWAKWIKSQIQAINQFARYLICNFQWKY